jgi:putative ABC transport system permease protein
MHHLSTHSRPGTIGRIARWLTVLAPVPLRATLAAEGVETLLAVCADARRRRGRIGAIVAALAEFGSLIRVALAARAGRTPRLSQGGDRTPEPSRKNRRVMTRVLNDFRLAVRSLLGAKGPVTIAIGTLALGIGVTSAVFSILDSLVLRPMPFPHAERLQAIWNFETKSQVSHPGFNRALFSEWRRQTDLFERCEGFDVTSFVYDAPSGAEMVTGAVVTPGLIPMLGARPLQGRLFADGEGRNGSDQVMLVSESFWSRTLGRDPAVLSRQIGLNGRRYAVVGVLPSSFRFPSEAASFWIPLDMDAPPIGVRGLPPRLEALALRRADVPEADAVARVRERGAELSRRAGGPAGRTAMLVPSGDRIDRKLRLSLYVLAGAVAFLLLIVSANLASLSLSRALARARDYAVRTSLGASRADLVRETLVEHLLMGAIGVGAGLVVASGVIRATLRILPEQFRVSGMNAIDLDGRAIAFTAVVGLVTSVLFGLPPAWLAARSAVAQALTRNSRSSTSSRSARRVRSALVVAEVTLAIVLLVGAALMARSLVKLQHVDRGFDTTGLIALRLGLPAGGYSDIYARDAFTERVIATVTKLPGVVGVTAGGVPPDSNMVGFGKLERGDRPGELTEDLVVPLYQVWPGYFSTVGIPLRAGRPFTDDDPVDSVIVSESFAQRLWPGGNAVGQRVRWEGETWLTIVGVAGEVRQMDLEDSNGSFEFYEPLKRPRGLPPPKNVRSGAIVEYRTLAVRSTNVPSTIARLRAAVHETDPGVVIWRLQPVDQLFSDAVARPRLVLLLMLVFAGMGLVLAAAGIYGVLSYAVVQRRREIGIRLALGARPEMVGRLILRNGLVLTGIGLVVGVALAAALMRVMRTLLYEVEPTDPMSVGVVVIVLLTVAAVASWRPARRAMRVDPVALLRQE